MKTLAELIEHMEFGLDRAECESWSIATILADADGKALLDDLKDAESIRAGLLMKEEV